MKVKTLIKKLQSYDPELPIEIMVDGEQVESQDHDYMFAWKLMVKKDEAMQKHSVLIYGELEGILHG